MFAKRCLDLLKTASNAPRTLRRTGESEEERGEQGPLWTGSRLASLTDDASHPPEVVGLEDLVQNGAHDRELDDAAERRDDERRPDAEAEQEREDGIEDDKRES